MLKKILSKISPTYKLLQEINDKIGFIIEALKKSMIDKKTIFPIYKDGIQFYFQDFIFSMVLLFVSKELGNGAYNFDNIDFKENDVCIDIGGNIGMTSIYLFKKYKIDCEGCEYEILYNTPSELLKRVEYLRGEFHDILILKKQGYTINKLRKYCKNYIPNIKLDYSRDY